MKHSGRVVNGLCYICSTKSTTTLYQQLRGGHDLRNSIRISPLSLTNPHTWLSVRLCAKVLSLILHLMLLALRKPQCVLKIVGMNPKLSSNINPIDSTIFLHYLGMSGEMSFRTACVLCMDYENALQNCRLSQDTKNVPGRNKENSPNPNPNPKP